MEKNLNEKFLGARKNEAGFIQKRINDEVKIISLYESNNDDTEEILDDFENSLDEEDIEDAQIELRKDPRLAGNNIQKKDVISNSVNKFQNRNKNSHLEKLAVKVVEYLIDNDKLPRNWQNDKDYLSSVSKLIMKKYDFKYDEILQTLKQLYQ